MATKALARLADLAIDQEIRTAVLETVQDKIYTVGESSGGAITLGSADLYDKKTTQKGLLISPDNIQRGVIDGSDAWESGSLNFGESHDHQLRRLLKKIEVNDEVIETFFRKEANKGATESELVNGISDVLGIPGAADQLSDNLIANFVTSSVHALQGGIAKYGAEAVVPSSGSVLSSATPIAKGALDIKKLWELGDLLGDKSDAGVVLLMHSKSANVLRNSLYDDSKGFGTADQVIQGYFDKAINKFVIKMDNDALVQTVSGVKRYGIMSLPVGALSGLQSMLKIQQGTTGTTTAGFKEFFQGSYRINQKVRGLNYIGSADPTDGNLASAANWTKVGSSVKNGPGTILWHLI